MCMDEREMLERVKGTSKRECSAWTCAVVKLLMCARRTLISPTLDRTSSCASEMICLRMDYSLLHSSKVLNITIPKYNLELLGQTSIQI